MDVTHTPHSGSTTQLDNYTDESINSLYLHFHSFGLVLLLFKERHLCYHLTLIDNTGASKLLPIGLVIVLKQFQVVRNILKAVAEILTRNVARENSNHSFLSVF